MYSTWSSNTPTCEKSQSDCHDAARHGSRANLGGSAIGDIDSATPSAAKTVAVGSNLSVTVGGTNDAAVGATVIFTILPTA